MKKRKPRKCIICQTKFKIPEGSEHQRGENIRPRRSVTCSKKCSKIYNRIYNYIKIKMRIKA